jgi:D-sedoheptulose 7-phosphate isomerase
MSLSARFQAAFTESIELKRRVLETQGPQVTAAAEMLAQVFKAGGRVLIFGNGGSAADAPGRPRLDHRYLHPHRGGQ